jgi:SAM-dependent methyltransferase
MEPLTSAAFDRRPLASGPALQPTERDHAEALRIAHGPLLFQAARSARTLGVLDVFADAGALGVTIDEVAAATGLSAYASRLLIDGCASLGMLSPVAEDRHAITGVGIAFLRDKRVTISTDFVHHVCHQGAFFLDESLVHGAPRGLPTLGPWSTVYEGVPHLPEPARSSWYAYDHSYSDGVFARAVRYLGQRGARRVLDVGGNTGRFASVAASSMDVTILDHAAELEVARRNVDALGVGQRVQTVPIDLLDRSSPFPSGFDTVWISQVLDCFAEDDIVSILGRARAALEEGGRIYVVESFTDRQPTEAARVALYALSLYFACIANGTSRMYDSGTLIRCAEKAGLKVEQDRTLGPWHTLLVLAA